MTPDRDAALALVREHTQNANLVKHMLCVEAAMRAYAKRWGEDEALWGLTGLLHDLDYEKHPSPEEHPRVGCRILEEKGWPKEMVEAILGHSDRTGVPRASRLAKALYACDEVTGLVVACALVRPSKKLAEVDVAGVNRKWKEKSFAKGVNRAEIEAGAADLGVPLDEHLETVIQALQGIAPELGL
jgi:putative nucleotidyltransferase with HDIG domain